MLMAVTKIDFYLDAVVIDSIKLHFYSVENSALEQFCKLFLWKKSLFSQGF